MSKQESNLCVDDKSATETTEQSHKKSLGCCGEYGRTVAHSLFRKKHFKDIFRNDLNKTLTTISLILYGLACMLDGGIYVSTGAVINAQTGPSAFLAYIIATFVAILNSLIYSELACHVPKVKSHLLSVEGIPSKSVVSHKLSSPDGLLSEYPDFLSTIVILIFGICCCFGLRKNLALTVISSAVNVGALLIATIYMFIHAKTNHHSIIYPGITTNIKYLLPYGILGLLSATTISFNAFVRSSAPSSRAQEVKRPPYSLPAASVTSILVVGLVTTLSALALTLYYPWFYVDAENAFLNALKDNKESTDAKFGRIFMFCLVGSGFVLGLLTSLISPMLASINICLAMVHDGFMPFMFSRVCRPFKRPLMTTIFIIIFTCLFSTIFTVQSLASFLSLGTLIAYCISAISVLFLRYRSQINDPEDINEYDNANCKGLLIYFSYGIKNTYRISEENESVFSSNCLSDIEYEKRSSKSNSSTDESIEFVDPIRF
ncbi:solute carrier family 7 (cationic amino acid transporter), member 4 [Schistosoma bovis]|uniref:Solute carrier family 7 (Cationic amino acid transporter), member 4 n=1 Tax=Schistosoma bovis TaxID=6184 RepID=A0A430QNJ9_SCHBO|nr:solute carrier family 7 (cationic amino acid transporter), member 4 [Schistosoma bovis]